MKFSILTAIIFYSLGMLNFSFALLLDNFKDKNLKGSILTKGTDVPNLQRGFVGDNWQLTNGVDFAELTSQKANLVGYALPQEDKLNFKDISTFNFTIECLTPQVSQPFTVSIYLMSSIYTNTSKVWYTDIIFPSVTNKITYSVDLKNRSISAYEYSTHFNSNDIQGIGIVFNTSEISSYLALDSIELVPEPFTTIILSGGIIRFITNKQIKKRFRSLNV